VDVDELVANLANHRQLHGVHQVVVELDHLLEADTDRLEGGLGFWNTGGHVDSATTSTWS
jgi:hypothetical protein